MKWSEGQTRPHKDNLVHKVHRALIGYDLDEVIITLMCALRIAIKEKHKDDPKACLDEIEIVSNYLITGLKRG